MFLQSQTKMIIFYTKHGGSIRPLKINY